MSEESYGEVLPEEAQEYRDVVVNALNAHIGGVIPADSDAVLNGTINAGCVLIQQAADEERRVHMVAEAIRLLLESSNVNPADVQAHKVEIENPWSTR